MRNILEQYCAFIKKEKYHNSVGSEDVGMITVLNKLLHSDLHAICDDAEIDKDQLNKAFQEIFNHWMRIIIMQYGY